VIAALASATMLVCTGSASADATERIENGGFETGATLFTAPPWIFTDAMACDERCGLPAASGSRYATSWDVSGDSAPPNSVRHANGHIEQSLVVPEAPAKLSFKFRIVATPGAPDVGEFLTVSLGGTVLTDISDEPSTSFQQVTLAIPPGQIQMSAQTLKFQVSCTNSSNLTAECDRIDIDDVSVVTGSPPDAPTITGTDPPSPADEAQPKVRGTVGAGGATEVKLYKNAACAGTADATGSVAEFTGAGIAVNVPDGSSTPLSASAANLAGDSTCSNSITYDELGKQAPPSETPPDATGTPPDATAAVFSSYQLSPTAFLAAARGPSIASRRPIGTRVSYTLSEPATVTFNVERGAKGHRVRGKCMRPTRGNRSPRRCVRYVALTGSFAHVGRSGSNSFKFTGRLRGRKLRPGAYRLQAHAVDPAGNASPVARKKFSIVRR
jgi:hypothetical protein